MKFLRSIIFISLVSTSLQLNGMLRSLRPLVSSLQNSGLNLGLGSSLLKCLQTKSEFPLFKFKNHLVPSAGSQIKVDEKFVSKVKLPWLRDQFSPTKTIALKETNCRIPYHGAFAFHRMFGHMHNKTDNKDKKMWFIVGILSCFITGILMHTWNDHTAFVEAENYVITRYSQGLQTWQQKKAISYSGQHSFKGTGSWQKWLQEKHKRGQPLDSAQLSVFLQDKKELKFDPKVTAKQPEKLSPETMKVVDEALKDFGLDSQDIKVIPLDETADSGGWCDSETKTIALRESQCNIPQWGEYAIYHEAAHMYDKASQKVRAACPQSELVAAACGASVVMGLSLPVFIMVLPLTIMFCLITYKKAMQIAHEQAEFRADLLATEKLLAKEKTGPIAHYLLVKFNEYYFNGKAYRGHSDHPTSLEEFNSVKDFLNHKGYGVTTVTMGKQIHVLMFKDGEILADIAYLNGEENRVKSLKKRGSLN